MLIHAFQLLRKCSNIKYYQKLGLNLSMWLRARLLAECAARGACDALLLKGEQAHDRSNRHNQTSAYRAGSRGIKGVLLCRLYCCNMREVKGVGVEYGYEWLINHLPLCVIRRGKFPGIYSSIQLLSGVFLTKGSDVSPETFSRPLRTGINERIETMKISNQFGHKLKKASALVALALIIKLCLASTLWVFCRDWLPYLALAWLLKLLLAPIIAYLIFGKKLFSRSPDARINANE